MEKKEGKAVEFRERRWRMVELGEEDREAVQRTARRCESDKVQGEKK